MDSEQPSVFLSRLIWGADLFGVWALRVRVTNRGVQVHRALVSMRSIRMWRWADDGTLLGFEAVAGNIEEARRRDLSLGQALRRFLFFRFTTFRNGEWQYYVPLRLGGVLIRTNTGRKFWFSTSHPDEVVRAINAMQSTR